MTTRDADSPTQVRQRRLQFGRYVLDLDGGCLLLDASEVALRPKTFGVLQYLVENSGRLVSKEELFAAIWPNLAVTDDALVQSIRELRRALGDDGRRLIRTLPRRGYRFDAGVSRIGPAGPSVTNGIQCSATFSDSSPSSEPAIRAQALTRVVALSSRRRGLHAALAVILLAAGVWTSLSHERSFLISLRSGDPSAKSAQVDTKVAIAILPFINQSDDPAREHFADGLTQDIIHALGRFTSLTVMSWNAVFPYKDKSASPREVAGSLAVRYQVEGSVRHTGERVRVAVQLVDRDGRVLWSASFDEAVAELFALQDKITAQIAGALAIRVTHMEQRRVSTKPTESHEAYEYLLLARPALERPTRANIVEARALLRRAIQLDPSYAAAYAALAETFHIAVSMGWAESPTALLSRAEEMASNALRLDGSEVRARVVLGRIHIFYRRYEQAQAEIDQAIAVNPSDAHGLAGRGNILLWLGQTDAAIEALELAERIDPEMNAFDRNALSLAYYLKHRYEAAIRQAEINMRNTGVAHFSHVMLAAASAQLNRTEDTARAVTMIRHTDPTFDPIGFGSKLMNPADLEHLRDGLRKAGYHVVEAGRAPSGN
jgi:TolB-like protein/DNA-binding winged helix-turn-helix (wHTH) protein